MKTTARGNNLDSVRRKSAESLSKISLRIHHSSTSVAETSRGLCGGLGPGSSLLASSPSEQNSPLVSSSLRRRAEPFLLQFHIQFHHSFIINGRWTARGPAYPHKIPHAAYRAFCFGLLSLPLEARGSSRRASP